MSIHTVKSIKSYKLYLIAAVLMFIETGIVAIVPSIIPSSGDWYTDWSLSSNLSIFLWLYPLIGVLFIVGAFFAKTGLGITGTVERRIGGGWVERRAETANGITCGCMTGLAVIIVTLAISMPHVEWTMGLILVGGIPAMLAGVIAMFAGFTSLTATSNKSQTGPVQYTRVEGPQPQVCHHCGRKGISPYVDTCPNCGQPLK